MAHRISSLPIRMAAAASLGFATVYALNTPINHTTPLERITQDAAAIAGPAVSPDCNIKGNIAVGSGERIYHVPGQTFYEQTVIRLDRGERWFCSEAEAVTAGWRPAHQ